MKLIHQYFVFAALLALLSPFVSAQEGGVGRVRAARDLKTKKSKARKKNNKARDKNNKAPKTTKSNIFGGWNIAFTVRFLWRGGGDFVNQESRNGP